MPERLTAEEIGKHLEGTRMDTVRVLSSVSSTNDVLMEMAKSGAPDGQVVIADLQTAGKGRAGRQFFSPPGMGLYLSYFVRAAAGDSALSVKKLPGDPDHETHGPAESPAGMTLEDWLPLTSWTAVAAADAVENACGVTPDIKWVNDLYLHGKKICGILVQPVFAADGTGTACGSIPAGMVIGIGINGRQRPEDFPEELREKATSVEAETGRPVDLSYLAAYLIREMDALRAAWPAQGADYLARYRAWSIAPGRIITVTDGAGSCAAEALGIGDDFSLLVRFSDGREEALRSGEISIRL